ncbi:hypothetical protein GDO81_006343 [Engystomops pustulosus]|uniref:Uncharacterized protein n=1 Tax=Engystomops pustulosus TaxID=76066 RepID=A0AAV7CX82_ENGPU|nr:hypothetical protein GDO81_006343 [Engystomops pustulosus]
MEVTRLPKPTQQQLGQAFSYSESLASSTDVFLNPEVLEAASPLPYHEWMLVTGCYYGLNWL